MFQDLKPQKLLEGSISIALFDIGLTNIFQICPSVKENKSKNKQTELYQLKIFAQQRKTISKMKKQTAE